MKPPEKIKNIRKLKNSKKIMKFLKIRSKLENTRKIKNCYLYSKKFWIFYFYCKSSFTLEFFPLFDHRQNRCIWRRTARHERWRVLNLIKILKEKKEIDHGKITRYNIKNKKFREKLIFIKKSY